MSAENRLWQALSIVVVLLTAAVPAYVTYDVYRRGPAPEKQVELTRFPPIDPMRDLSALGDRVTLSLRVEDQVMNNLVIAKAFLRNAGAVPIVSSDYHENLSITVKKPWKIVSVENSKDFVPGIEFRWRRISDTRFEAEPALLNPGDLVSTNVYLTNTQFAGASATEKQPEVQVEWKARVTNLRAFTEPPSLSDRLNRTAFGIDVHLAGWGLPFTIIAALLFQALYLHLLSRSGFLRGWTWRSITLVLGASLLSFAAAESSATYFFGHPLSELFGLGVNHWINAPWIVLHAGALGVLYWKAGRTQPRDRDNSPTQLIE